MKLSQDLKQRITGLINCAIELYRVITSTLPILFVPQNCATGDQEPVVCSLNDNLELGDAYYTVTLVFNFFTLAVFLVMYFFEIRRENLLITNLDVNNELPTSDEDVSLVLEKLPEKSKRAILWVDLWYMRTAMASLTAFVANAFLSGFCLYRYYLNNQTTTTFVTYLLFMVIKLTGVWTVVRTEKNVFYSSYLKTNVQYNDLDENLKTCLEPAHVRL
jgi:hypothetical protein